MAPSTIFDVDKDDWEELTPALATGEYYAETCPPSDVVYVPGSYLAKAKAKPDEDKAAVGDERWVTVHPGFPGKPSGGYPEGSGVPVLIKRRPDGSYTVIGGAGGKLTGLRLTGIKSKGQYAKEREKREGAREGKRFAATVSEEEIRKIEAAVSERKVVAGTKEKALREKIGDVVGVEMESKLTRDVLKEIKSEAESAAAKKKITDERSKRDFVRDQVGKAVKDEQKRQRYIVDEVVDQARLKVAGKEEEDAELVKLLKKELGGKRAAKTAIKEMGKEQAAEIMRLYYEAREAKRGLHKVRKAEKRAKGEGLDIGGAWEIPATELSEAEVKKMALEEHVEKQHRLIVGGLIGEVDSKASSRMKEAMGTGAYSALNTVSGEYARESIINQSTVELIGVNNAAIVMSEYLKGALGEKVGKEKGEEIQAWIAKNAARVAKEALDEAQGQRERAEKARAGAKGDVPMAGQRSANGRALRYLNDANFALGQAVGQIEAFAAAGWALTVGDYDHIEVADGKTREALNTFLDNLGLHAWECEVSRHDDLYHIKVDEENFHLLLREEGLGKVEAKRERATKIKALEENKEGWLPEGLREDVTLADGTKIKLRETFAPAQQAGVRFVEAQKKCYLDFEPGLGKTLTYAASALHLRAQGKVKRCLISMPASVLPQFKEEIERFTTEKAVIISGNKTKRTEQYKGDQFFTLINKEKFSFDETGIAEGKFDMVINDEAHMLSQRQARGAKQSYMSEAFSRIAGNADYLVDGSGTPVPNDLSELFFHLHLINPNKYPSQKEFMKKYGKLHKDKTVVAAGAVRTLREEFENHLFSQELKLKPKKHEHEVKVELTPEQKKELFRIEEAYRTGELSNAFYRENQQSAVINETKGALGGKVAALKQTIAQHKIRRGDSSKMLIFADTYKSLAVVADSVGVPKDELIMLYGKDPKTGRQTSFGERQFIREHFNRGVKKFREKYDAVLKSDTATPVEKRSANKALAYIKGKKDANYCLLSPAGTTGVNLQTANGVILYNVSNTGALEEQKMKRAYRKGVKHDVDVYRLTTEAPMELRQRSLLGEKMRIGELLGNVEDTRGLFS